MKYTVPDYYHEFHCIAGECPATCCAGWQIVIDERSLKRYKKHKGPFGNRLRNSIDWEEGIFHQYNGRCAFLDENNLCDIYTEAGPHMFCRTCRNYPRHIEEFENEREISLSLSCPVAAELILGRREKVTFLTAEKECEEECDEDFDFFLYSALQDCRSTMLLILQNRKEHISFRMAKVLALAHDVQNRIDARRIFEVGTLLERYQNAGADMKLKEKFRLFLNGKSELKQEKKEKYLSISGMLEELEVLDPSWTAQLDSWKKILEQTETGVKEEVRKRITETELEQLMVYFLFTYFCGAVYDGDALAKVKMAVVCTLILEELWTADVLLEQKLQQQTEQMGIACSRNRTAWRFSRELEHSDPNLEKMEQMMNEREETAFEALLQRILESRKEIGYE